MRFKILLTLLIAITLASPAQKLKQIKSLSGYWSFSVGDDVKWRLPDHVFSGWDRISIGTNWESQGYDGYNGYAWYKRRVEIPKLSANTKLILQIERIDDADEVYFNGTLIGRMGGFPPDVQTAWSQVRRYPVPSELIHFDGANVIAVRVYDVYLNGGILGQAGLYIDAASTYMLTDLSGLWKFKPGNSQRYSDYNYNDESWDTVNVPQTWESQGYPNLDGYAWYRKTFSWERAGSGEDVVMVLGRIDDKDMVYLNGQWIGSIDEMKKGSYHAGKEDYQTLRAYRIPRNMLHRGKNVLAVRVWDDRLDGGIYEGPLGIMTVQAFESYFTEHEERKSLFEYFLDRFFD
ncbi:sialate O-acetylesterase [Saccharicrinis carchari]|uniref:Sialate O-acetylesterase n=1 Tax=Saccharicrinis carchari TaxID=1168039 RepID=A0A521DPQ8_SACCC|nr:sugar-binding domain-containing protein [Saccharicrinis carchari]SMO72900.1 sialate O-acetylesterase [Saccharicrinis carchari]